MDAYTRDILSRFGSTVFAQTILNKDRNNLDYLVRKYAIKTPSAKEVTELAAQMIAEQFKK